MLPSILIATILIWGAVTIYFAARSRNFRKFLAGAFFASAGIQLYLFVVGVSVPLIGTSFVQTPELSAIRSSIHFVLFLSLFTSASSGNRSSPRPCVICSGSGLPQGGRLQRYVQHIVIRVTQVLHLGADTSKGRAQSQDSKFVAGCLTCRIRLDASFERSAAADRVSVCIPVSNRRHVKALGDPSEAR